MSRLYATVTRYTLTTVKLRKLHGKGKPRCQDFAIAWADLNGFEEMAIEITLQNTFFTLVRVCFPSQKIHYLVTKAVGIYSFRKTASKPARRDDDQQWSLIF